MIFIWFTFSSFGIYIPIFYLAQNIAIDGIKDKTLLFQTYMGLAWMIGCVIFGVLVVRNSMECRIARQYLCQVSVFMCGLCMLAFSGVGKSFEGYIVFVWTYGKCNDLTLI